jgi:hypothetical protein
MAWKVSTPSPYLTIMQLTVYFISRTPQPISDRSDHIIGALTGQPHDPSRSDIEKDASQAIHHGGGKASFMGKRRNHHRGPFPALAVIVPIGGDQKVCTKCVTIYTQPLTIPKVAGNLLNGTINTVILALLLANTSIQHFAGCASCKPASLAYNPTLTPQLSAAVNLFALRFFVYYTIEL